MRNDKRIVASIWLVTLLLFAFGLLTARGMVIQSDEPAAGPSGPTELSIYVDPDATGAGDGSSWADAYTSLDTALDTEAKDLVASNEYAVFYCNSSAGSADTNNIDLTGTSWNTGERNSGHYIKVMVPDSDRHNGAWDSSSYRITYAPTSNYVEAIDVGDNINMRIEGMQISYDSGDFDNNGAIRLNHSGNTEIIVSDCVIRQTYSNATGSEGIGYTGSNSTSKIYNNIIYDFEHNIRYNADHYSRAIIYSNTVYNATTGNISYDDNFTTDPKLYLKNNVAQGGVVDFNPNHTSDFTSFVHVTNLAEDATSPDGLQGTVQFVDETNDDFHLSSQDNTAIDSGTDLSGDAQLSFTTDIDEEIRDASWDIGADEYVP